MPSTVSLLADNGAVTSGYASVYFPESPNAPRRVYKVTLRQEVFSHDYADIYFRDWKVNPSTIKPMTKIVLTIRNKKYHGFVHNVENVQESAKNFTKIGFIGASHVFRQSSQKIYRDVTASQVIVELAKKYNFAYKVTPHKRVYSSIVQGGRTDWQLMVDLANECGYFLRAENTEIYFHPLMEDFNYYINEAVIFDKGDAGFKGRRPIYNFSPVISETMTHFGFKKAATSIAGVNPIDGTTFKITNQDPFTPNRVSSNPESFDDHDTTAVANDYTTASLLAKSSDDYSSFPYIADVDTIGIEKVRPCLPVYLNNVGDQYSGYWTVLSIRHEVIEAQLNQPLYTCSMTVATDSLGQISDPNKPVIPPTNPVRTIIPNVDNTVIVPQTVINSPGLSIIPIPQYEIVDRINRPGIDVQLASVSKWASTHGDLNYRYSENNMPPIVRAKVITI